MMSIENIDNISVFHHNGKAGILSFFPTAPSSKASTISHATWEMKTALSDYGPILLSKGGPI